MAQPPQTPKCGQNAAIRSALARSMCSSRPPSGWPRIDRNEPDIDYDDVRPRRQPLALIGSNIGLLQRDDFRMAMQGWMQLAAPDIDGKHQAGAVGEQHLGEAAGGCADVEADVVLDLDRVALQRARQFDAAARHEAMRRLRLPCCVHRHTLPPL